MNKSSHILSEKKRTMVFLCLVISGIASSILSTAMSTALPSLVEYFGISTSTGQWITSGYSLVMGMVLPLSAFLIVRIPTKKLYLSGIGIFIVGLLFSILTKNFVVMMVGRCLQAGGAAVLQASSLLTSLRTIAGSIGAAVFVGIMTMVSDGASASYGSAAPMHGMNVSFLCMAACSAVLTAIAVFAIRPQKAAGVS